VQMGVRNFFMRLGKANRIGDLGSGSHREGKYLGRRCRGSAYAFIDDNKRGSFRSGPRTG
jgi:hypothetical protein